ncbi:orf, hypothetical [Kosakonia radicincitans]|uniref:type II toxin-antitoxin system RelB/DinJ family antitoxin n=1 Tax=Kosakonia radicincitans TaxID=283686 RepID=UPI001183DED1|nr:type II toxin-antitoxin system RelB/DinJ family antitoxin [Kosakonia radicincitans]VVT48728.1 orf, hypothetical [Kosakonia radicincitans]
MATINARIDDETKAQVDQVLGLLGISQTQAITAFYQYIASHGKLPLIITQHVTTAEDINSKIRGQFIKASASLNNLKNMIKNAGVVDGRDAQREYRQLRDIHISVWNEMSNIGYSSEFMLLADALKSAISELVDLRNFGYGFQLMKVTEEECSKFSAATEYFDHIMTNGSGENKGEIMPDNYIVTLDSEVRELEELHKQSMTDPTLTMPERTAIASEYCAKYKKLECLALTSVTTYSE